MIVLAGLAPDIDAARALADARLADGSAAERFGRMVAALGGPADFVERPADYLPQARRRPTGFPGQAGFVAGMNAKAVGLALVALGGGRKRPDEPIDLTVGLTDFCQIGDRVGPDTPLCVIHAAERGGMGGGGRTGPRRDPRFGDATRRSRPDRHRTDCPATAMSAMAICGHGRTGWTPPVRLPCWSLPRARPVGGSLNEGYIN